MVRQSASWRTVESRYLDAPLASDHQPVLVVLEWLGHPAAQRHPLTGEARRRRGNRQTGARMLSERRRS